MYLFRHLRLSQILFCAVFIPLAIPGQLAQPQLSVNAKQDAPENNLDNPIPRISRDVADDQPPKDDNEGDAEGEGGGDNDPSAGGDNEGEDPSGDNEDAGKETGEPAGGDAQDTQPPAPEEGGQGGGGGGGWGGKRGRGKGRGKGKRGRGRGKGRGKGRGGGGKGRHGRRAEDTDSPEGISLLPHNSHFHLQ